jgi:single-strand DNA-binding protein
MKSVNTVILVGHVGNDPEVRSTTGGTRVATLSLATNDSWTDEAGQRQERTEWHRLQAWSGLADVVEKYVRKGAQLYVSGRIAYRQWQDREGRTRYSTEINVREIVMLGARRAGADDPGEAAEAPAGAGPAATTPPAARPAAAKGGKAKAGEKADGGEVPF